MNEQLTFPHTYQIRQIPELPKDVPIYYYPGATTFGGRDGIIAEVVSNGNAWVGIFGFGFRDSECVSGIYSMPNDSKLCVVAEGVGYIVSAADPLNWEQVKSLPVKEVRSFISLGIIIFANDTDIIAYDINGMIWKTKRLSFHGLKLLGATETNLHGEYYDIRTEQTETFIVDLKSGDHQSSAGDIEW